MRDARGVIAALTSADTDEWNTPAWILDLARSLSATGRIALDPCWNDRALSMPAARFTKDDDGLAHDWAEAVSRADPGGIVWVNYPYSGASAWASKIRREAARPLEILSLARVAVSTRWWSSLVWRSATSVAFFYTRLAHVDETGEEKKGSTFDSALIYHGFHADLFREALAPHAAVVGLR